MGEENYILLTCFIPWKNLPGGRGERDLKRGISTGSNAGILPPPLYLALLDMVRADMILETVGEEGMKELMEKAQKKGEGN